MIERILDKVLVAVFSAVILTTGAWLLRKFTRDRLIRFLGGASATDVAVLQTELGTAKREIESLRTERDELEKLVDKAIAHGFDQMKRDYERLRSRIP